LLRRSVLLCLIYRLLLELTKQALGKHEANVWTVNLCQWL
jgi:hypothetical protein